MLFTTKFESGKVINYINFVGLLLSGLVPIILSLLLMITKPSCSTVNLRTLNRVWGKDETYRFAESMFWSEIAKIVLVILMGIAWKLGTSGFEGIARDSKLFTKSGFMAGSAVLVGAAVVAFGAVLITRAEKKTEDKVLKPNDV